MEEVRGKGQPRRFATAEDFENSFINYLDECDTKQKLPNIAGFCVYAYMDRDTYYAQKEYYSDTFKRVENLLEDKAINAKINDTFKIFYMKNKFGYKDRTELDNNITANVKTTDLTHLTTEQIRELLKNEDKN